MPVVKINAITVPEGQGEQLEARFAQRNHSVEQADDFESFQLLRPVSGETRYFVVSTWKDEQSYQNWHTSQSGQHHGGNSPVATTAQLLEFVSVDL